MKRFLILIIIFCCFGCTGKVSVIKKGSSNSLTYLFFKDFDIKHYVVYFYDRNVTKNDDSTIVIARDDDKYYYEYDGSEKRKIIQINGYKYTISDSLNSYFKEESGLEDYSLGILPSDVSKLKVLGYKTGNTRVYNASYVFEEYKLDGFNVIYYYKGKKLVYVRSSSPSGSSFIKFDRFGKVSEKMFELPKDFNEMSY